MGLTKMWSYTDNEDNTFFLPVKQPFAFSPYTKKRSKRDKKIFRVNLMAEAEEALGIERSKKDSNMNVKKIASEIIKKQKN